MSVFLRFPAQGQIVYVQYSTSALRAESIERFIDGQAFLGSYDSAPPPPESYDRKKIWPSVNHSILSASD
jgi:hypothetical protein